ncbi:MAG: hypothetical protein QOJ63_2663 [Solirubrobacteraceae bacterium]|nr:hypothetical protein [Solirubrobacteraceae bacterium]
MRVGIVKPAGALTTGARSASSTTLPPLPLAPPWAVSPTNPVVPAGEARTSGATSIPSSERPNKTEKPVSSRAPEVPSQLSTVGVAAAGTPGMALIAAATALAV